MMSTEEYKMAKRRGRRMYNIGDIIQFPKHKLTIGLIVNAIHNWDTLNHFYEIYFNKDPIWHKKNQLLRLYEDDLIGIEQGNWRYK